jgi:CHAT domain-containing protein
VEDETLEEIRAARRELDDVIEEIRAIDGYEDFLRPPTFDDLVAAAGEQPLVYLAAVEPGGLAFIVRGGAVESVDLPELTLDAVHERVGGHLDAYARFGAVAVRSPRAGDAFAAARAAWWRSLDDVTGWLWPTVMGPVLQRLGDCPRGAVLVAGGLLGLLPLHAAWTEDGGTATGRRYALDHTEISYVPNARSLAAAREVAAATPGTRLLAVVDPQPQPHPAPPLLPMAAVEAAAAAEAFPGATVSLAGERATVGTVRGELTPAAQEDSLRADVLHLACHGSALLDQPLDSYLLLARGERLRLRELLALRLRVRLAVLSACETSRPGTDLPDEVVSLPTGLLQAGVAGVVASLWAVSDDAAAMAMVEFYRWWRWEGLAPARALRRALRWVRDTTNEQKMGAWERAVAEEARWLPAGVADKLLDTVSLRDPDARDEAEIAAWAAFSYVGV